MCYGRFDTNSHNLFDIDTFNEKTGNFPGLDYSNVMLEDFTREKIIEKIIEKKLSNIDKKKPRMPWF